MAAEGPKFTHFCVRAGEIDRIRESMSPRESLGVKNYLWKTSGLASEPFSVTFRAPGFNEGHLSKSLRRKTLAAGTGHDRIRVCDFEASLLEVFTVVEF